MLHDPAQCAAPADAGACEAAEHVTVVIHFQFRDARAGERAWWLAVEDGVADLCRDDPGRELTLVVQASVRALTEVWAGGGQTPA